MPWSGELSGWTSLGRISANVGTDGNIDITANWPTSTTSIAATTTTTSWAVSLSELTNSPVGTFFIPTGTLGPTQNFGTLEVRDGYGNGGGGAYPITWDENFDQGAVERATDARVHARSRAEELLISLLSDAQLEQYRLNGSFEVIGSEGNVYRIERGVSGNVLWLWPDGEPRGRLCAHPTMRETWLPDSDVAVAQLLALVTDERRFIQTANVHGGERPVYA